MKDEEFKNSQEYNPKYEYSGSESYKAGKFLGLDFDYVPGDPGI